MSLSKRIRELRYAKGWGPDDLAEHAGLSRTALYNIERERTLHPHAATLQQIARALDVSIEDLFDRPDGSAGLPTEPPGRSPSSDPMRGSGLSAERLWEIQGKFLELLDSPLGDGIALLVEQSHRLLPPPPPRPQPRSEDPPAAPSPVLPTDGGLRI
jgi:transcriptional regulator with XRE-family HTH domain